MIISCNILGGTRRDYISSPLTGTALIMGFNNAKRTRATGATVGAAIYGFAKSGSTIIGLASGDRKLWRSSDNGASFTQDGSDFCAEALISGEATPYYDSVNAKWIISGKSAANTADIWYSSTGAAGSFTNVNLDTSATNSIGTGATGGGYTVIPVGTLSGFKTFTSANGTTYTDRGARLRTSAKPAYGAGRFIGIGAASAGASVAYADTSDLSTWTTATLPATLNTICAFAYNATLSRWVVVGSVSANFYAAYSSDNGVTWTACTVPTVNTDSMYAVTAITNGFACVGNNASGPLALYSADGITWTQSTYTTTAPLLGMVAV